MSHSSLSLNPDSKQELQPAADAALRRLLDGNGRWVSDQCTHPHQGELRRRDVARAQHPFAIVLTCADSRVVPELLFDQGLGDLFVLRVGGNILDDALLGTIEFAVQTLDVPLIVVLGHDQCGAMQSALGALTDGPLPTNHVSALVTALQPAIEEALREGGDVLDGAVRANVRHVVRQLVEADPIVAERVRGRRLDIVGAYYDMEQGLVQIIPT